MSTLDVIEERYSVRSYRPDPVETDKLTKILEAGRLAPTAANRQAFKILVIEPNGREEELKAIYNRDWFVAAPLIIAVCIIPEQCWVRKDGKNYGDVDGAIVMDHMILTAAELGLGTCWIGAFDTSAATKILGLDPAWEPIAFTPVGYPQGNPVSKIRKSINDLVVYL